MLNVMAAAAVPVAARGDKTRSGPGKDCNPETPSGPSPLSHGIKRRTPVIPAGPGVRWLYSSHFPVASRSHIHLLPHPEGPESLLPCTRGNSSTPDHRKSSFRAASAARGKLCGCDRCPRGQQWWCQVLRVCLM